MELRLLQREVAERLGVTDPCVYNWERNAARPEVRYMPAIIEFLGYNPLPEATTLAERLVRHRITLGMTQKQVAAEIDVDQGTLTTWERGEREPAGEWLGRVERFLEAAVIEEKRAGEVAARSASKMSLRRNQGTGRLPTSRP